MEHILASVISLLPGSPFSVFIREMSSVPYLGYANYFLPMSEMIAIGQAWLTAITAFYLLQVILRWVKAIE